MQSPILVLVVSLAVTSSYSVFPADLTLRKAPEQSIWLTPRTHGGYISFEAVLSGESAQPDRVDVSISLVSDFPIADIGRLRVDIRTNGFWKMQSLSELELPHSSDPLKGEVSLSVPTMLDGAMPIAIGANQLAILTERIPALRYSPSGSLRVKMKMRAEWKFETVSAETEVAFKVRSLYPEVRVDDVKTAYADFTVYIEGGLPFQEYELEQSYDLLGWRPLFGFKNFVGDSSTGVRHDTTTRFFRVLPVNAVTARSFTEVRPVAPLR